METGACYYCGQYHQVEMEKDEIPTEELLNKKATDKCDCFEAKLDQKKKEALEQIDTFFSEEFPEMAELMAAAIKPIQTETVDKITVDTGAGVKGKISKTAKGYLKIERIDTRKKVREL